MKFEEAMKLFGFKVESKQTCVSIKKKYRELALKVHPDQGGNAALFILINKAFEVLYKVFGKVVEVRELDGDLEVADGRKLSELGKGYPITENARTCDNCGGKGYKQFSGLSRGTGEYRACRYCGGDGLVSYPCKKCGGTGRYIHPKTKKDTGECYSCRGTGKFYPYKKVRLSRFSTDWGFGGWEKNVYIPGTQKLGQVCSYCKGTKEEEIMMEGGPVYSICSKCDGVGEIKMWNPVIPRGLFKRS
jgi:DnaJ-class molecular chaperone